MKNSSIEILGITSEEEISKHNIQYPYKEFCKSYTISLVNNNLKIGKILKVFLEPKITEWKYIFTQEKYKIFMEGSINIKVLFLENLYDENIYSTESNKIISGFLPVDSNYTDNLKPTLFVEEAFISHLNENKLSVSLLIGLATNLQIENEDVTEYTGIIQVEDNLKEGIKYNNMEEENLKEEVKYEEVEYEDATDLNLKEESQYKEIENVNLKEEVIGSNRKENLQYTEVEDTNSKKHEQYGVGEESNLKEKIQYEYNLNEEKEYKDIKDANFREELEYKNEKVDSNKLDERNFEEKVYDVNLKEIGFEKRDIDESDMENLKKDSINIEVEYDMNWNENN